MRKESEKQGASSWAEGAISILSVLENRSRPVDRILLLPEAKREEKNILRLLKLAKAQSIPVFMSDREFFDRVTTGHTHGGVIACVGDRAMLSPDEVFQRGDGFVFLLCGVEDPFNFGASIRSFYAAGAGGMILSPRNWMSAAGVVIRSSAGTSEAFPCAVYDDPNDLIRSARNAGYRVVCASEEGATDLFRADLTKPVFLIVGGEKRGISKEFLQNADLKIRIPYGRRFAGSLTASSAAGICAFEVLRVNREG